jgi:hypothetical protein
MSLPKYIFLPEIDQITSKNKLYCKRLPISASFQPGSKDGVVSRLGTPSLYQPVDLMRGSSSRIPSGRITVGCPFAVAHSTALLRRIRGNGYVICFLETSPSISKALSCLNVSASQMIKKIRKVCLLLQRQTRFATELTTVPEPVALPAMLLKSG